MSLSVKSANVGYTNQGNPYQKSKVGKNVGTAVGLGMLIPATMVTAKNYGASCSQYVSACVEHFKECIRSAEHFGRLSTDMGRKFFNVLSKHKSARVASLVALASLPVMLYAGIGRLLGHGVDKIIDSGAKKQADIEAKSQKA